MGGMSPTHVSPVIFVKVSIQVPNGAALARTVRLR